ncbi:SDR family NAD(P)-dependent oxidoreductase, partial [Massilia sp. DJPM01]|uniref:SDR family NAD(P)-dependent oxidoreductase n=1 Tax=Massilia sp. DJPM01 TaxID=3024404 RepID=UPI0035A369BD
MQRGEFSAGQCYEVFEQMGISYGPAHRAIAALHAGDAEVLARLSLPSCGKQFVLHPGLLDSAIQASLGLLLDSQGMLAEVTPMLPFALDRVDVLAPCSAEMWALIVPATDAGADSALQKLDITLCDETGRVCVRLNGFSSRKIGAKTASTEAASDQPAVRDMPLPDALSGVVMLHPQWQQQALQPVADVAGFSRHLVLLCDMAAISAAGIKEALGSAQCQSLQGTGADAAARFSGIARHVFEAMQALLQDKPRSDVLVQVVVPADGEQAVLAGLSGLLKTVALENPRIRTQLIALSEIAGAAQLAAILRAESAQATASVVRYSGAARSVARLDEMLNTAVAAHPWREQGVYLITGGAGALGLVFARAILAQTTQATVILSGRSALDEAQQTQLTQLGAVYRQLDVADGAAVERLVAAICDEFGPLTGILHSAGVLRDSYLLK